MRNPFWSCLSDLSYFLFRQCFFIRCETILLGNNFYIMAFQGIRIQINAIKGVNFIVIFDIEFYIAVEKVAAVF